MSHVRKMIICPKRMQKNMRYYKCMQRWSMEFLNQISKLLLEASLILNNFILPLHNLSLSLDDLLMYLIKLIVTLKGVRMMCIHSSDHYAYTIYSFFLLVQSCIHFFNVKMEGLETLFNDAHHVRELTLNSSFLFTFNLVRCFRSQTRFKNVTR